MARSFLAATALAAILSATLLGGAPAAPEESYPARPVKIVMPVPPGSALDVVTRLVGEQLTSRWGQQVVVENRPGAGGLIAAQAVAVAPPDGYTLLGGAGSIFTILPAQKERLPFDVSRDFIQVGMILGSAPMYLAVSPKLGVSSFAEFVALAKAKPGEIVVGTNGAGTLPNFAGFALAGPRHYRSRIRAPGCSTIRRFEAHRRDVAQARPRLSRRPSGRRDGAGL